MTPYLAFAVASSRITAIDWLVIMAYFGILLGVATWVVRKGKDSAADYFLAGRNLGWWVIGASIFASNIGSEHVVGLAGSGATSGVAMAHYELHAWCLLLLGWVFVPFYMRSKVFTMPEFLERRFSVKSRYVLSIVSILTFIVSKIAVGIFAGGVVFSTLFPEVRINIAGLDIDSFWIGSVAVIVLTGLYTVLGGMRAVAYNDAVQVVVLICGSALLTVYGVVKLGGWSELRHICGSDMFNLWKPLIPAGQTGTWAPVIVKSAGHIVKQAWYFNDNFPWLGMLFCAPIIGMWYWCTDQYIVQRALGAPDETTARRGSIFASFLKLAPVYLFIVPGLVCYALAKSGKIPELAPMIGPDGNAIPSVAQGSFPMMVEYLLPPGLRGIVVAGLLSALMGSLAGVFNACSTLFTVDLYEKWKPAAIAAPDRADRPHCHRCHGADRAGLDPGHQGRAGALHLFAMGAGLPGAAHLRGLLLRRLFQTPQRAGRILGHGGRLHAGHLPHVRGHAGHARLGRVEERLPPKDPFFGSSTTSTFSTLAC